MVSHVSLTVPEHPCWCRWWRTGGVLTNNMRNLSQWHLFFLKGRMWQISWQLNFNGRVSYCNFKVKLALWWLCVPCQRNCLLSYWFKIFSAAIDMVKLMTITVLPRCILLKANSNLTHHVRLAHSSWYKEFTGSLTAFLDNQIYHFGFCILVEPIFFF